MKLMASWRDHLRPGEREVAFILAVFVVDDDDHAASADFLNRFRNISERSLGAP